MSIGSVSRAGVSGAYEQEHAEHDRECSVVPGGQPSGQKHVTVKFVEANRPWSLTAQRPFDNH